MHTLWKINNNHENRMKKKFFILFLIFAVLSGTAKCFPTAKNPGQDIARDLVINFDWNKLD